MLLIQPFPGGTVDGARAHLVAAQGFAGAVANDPVPSQTNHVMEKLLSGVQSAKLAAAELFMAPPRSEFQDLVAARQHVIAGQQLLAKAVSAQGSALGLDHSAVVKQFASDAFNAFEDAFEILDND